MLRQVFDEESSAGSALHWSHWYLYEMSFVLCQIPLLPSRCPPTTAAPVIVGSETTDGWVSYQLIPESDFVVKNGYSVQFYVRAYRKGDPSKGDIYGSSLVQVATQQP